MSVDNIVIHVMNQMYELDWFSEETMTTWEETNDDEKAWTKCQMLIENPYIARK